MPLFGNPNIITGSLTAGSVSTTGTCATGALTVTGTSTLNGATGVTGDLTATSGDLRLATAGKGIRIKEGGAAARMGVATLVAGTATIATTAVGVDSRVFLMGQVDGGGTEGFYRVSTRTPATSFVITSSQGTDTSDVAWLIIDPS